MTTITLAEAERLGYSLRVERTGDDDLSEVRLVAVGKLPEVGMGSTKEEATSAALLELDASLAKYEPAVLLRVFAERRLNALLTGRHDGSDSERSYQRALCRDAIGEVRTARRCGRTPSASNTTVALSRLVRVERLLAKWEERDANNRRQRPGGSHVDDSEEHDLNELYDALRGGR